MTVEQARLRRQRRFRFVLGITAGVGIGVGVGGLVVLTVALLPDDGAVPAIAFGIVAWFLVVVVGSRSSTFWTPR
ncbi:MAG: hypothetical protein ACJ76W_01880 [Chloroflexota bacterium]